MFLTKVCEAFIKFKIFFLWCPSMWHTTGKNIMANITVDFLRNKIESIECSKSLTHFVTSYYLLNLIKSSLFQVEQTLLTILCLNACTSLLTFYWLSSDTETCTGAPLKVYSNLKFTHDGKYVVVQFFSLVQFFLNWYRIYWTGTKLQLTTVELKLIPGRQVDKK